MDRLEAYCLFHARWNELIANRRMGTPESRACLNDMVNLENAMSLDEWVECCRARRQRLAPPDPPPG